ncbi:MAG: hypothetical protein SFZ03_00405 [Candidatus Melainabacteria bacterium]|nr:hypothetical protein [Candidatus Melainabacteria bacterium]
MKIRRMGWRHVGQVVALLQRFGEGSYQDSLLSRLGYFYVPVQHTSQCLPAPRQFVPAIYVAVANTGKVLGLIWLSPDGVIKTRWRIEQLIIDPEESPMEVGTHLVNFVVHHYGADGIQTFVALVNQRFEEALGLLKACGFRHCTRLHTYEFQARYPQSLPTEWSLEAGTISGLRESATSDSRALMELYHDCLPVEVRLSLEKKPADFIRPWWRDWTNRWKGGFYRRWVVCSSHTPEQPLPLLAALDLWTSNYYDYELSLMVSPAWQEGYSHLLLAALQQVLKTTASPRVRIQVFDFQKEAQKNLERLGFEWQSVAELLVKDYWLPVQSPALARQTPILLFGGRTSPACLIR